MSSGKDHKNYMARLDGFLKQFTSKALIDQPDNLPEYMLEAVNQTLGLVLSESEHEELLSLRSYVKNHSKGRETSSSSDSEDDEVDDLPLPAKSRLSTHRTSVSAEAFGAHNKREDFHPRVIPKNEQQKVRILERLSKSFMFSVLDENEKNIIINAMDEKDFKTGDVVIRQGEEGNELYVVDSGKLECTKVSEGSEVKVLKVYHSGEAFGELALLYNAPRAATITCTTNSKLWVLDRGTFIHIVKDAAVKKRERFEEFLSNVELFKGLDPYERAQIADALKSASYEKDEYVIKQGDWGDVFYLVVSGTAVAKKQFYTGGPEVEVKQYLPGDYFGELSMLKKGEKRAASIIATSELKCVSLNRKAFQRMIGKLDDILRRNAATYSQSAPK